MENVQAKEGYNPEPVSTSPPEPEKREVLVFQALLENPMHLKTTPGQYAPPVAAAKWWQPVLAQVNQLMMVQHSGHLSDLQLAIQNVSRQNSAAATLVLPNMGQIKVSIQSNKVSLKADKPDTAAKLEQHHSELQQALNHDNDKNLELEICR